jgi:hypothetical protein
MNRRIKKKKIKAADKYRDIALVFNNKTAYQKIKICKKFFIDLNIAFETRLDMSYNEKLRFRRCNRRDAGNLARGWILYALAYPKEEK